MFFRRHTREKKNTSGPSPATTFHLWKHSRKEFILTHPKFVCVCARSRVRFATRHNTSYRNNTIISSAEDTILGYTTNFEFQIYRNSIESNATKTKPYNLFVNFDWWELNFVFGILEIWNFIRCRIQKHSLTDLSRRCFKSMCTTKPETRLRTFAFAICELRFHSQTQTHTCFNHCVWPVVLLTRIQCIRNRWIVVLLNAQTALLDGTQCSYGHEWVWVFLLPTADVSFAALHFVPLVWFKRIFLEHFTTSAILLSSSFFLGIKCIAIGSASIFVTRNNFILLATFFLVFRRKFH